MTALLILSVSYCTVRGAFVVGREVYEAAAWFGRAVASVMGLLRADDVEVQR